MSFVFQIRLFVDFCLFLVSPHSLQLSFPFLSSALCSLVQCSELGVYFSSTRRNINKRKTNENPNKRKRNSVDLYCSLDGNENPVTDVYAQCMYRDKKKPTERDEKGREVQVEVEKGKNERGQGWQRRRSLAATLGLLLLRR